LDTNVFTGIVQKCRGRQHIAASGKAETPERIFPARSADEVVVGVTEV